MTSTENPIFSAGLNKLRSGDVAGFLAVAAADPNETVRHIREQEGHVDFLNHMILCYQRKEYAHALELSRLAEAAYGKTLIALKIKYTAMLAVDMQRYYRDAVATMEEILRSVPDDKDTLWNLGQYGQWGGEDARGSLLRTVDCYTRLISFGDQDNAELHRRIGDAQMELRDYAQARRHYLEARALNPAFAERVDAVLLDIDAVLGRDAAAEQPEKKAAKSFFSRYPEQAEFKKSRLEFIQADAAKIFSGVTFIDKTTKFLTIGSCFAENICGFLLKSGYDAQTIPCAEYINSTFANRVLIDWLLGENRPDDPNFSKIAKYVAESGRSQQQLLQRLRECDVFIYSLGVGAGFFRREDGAFVMPGPSEINQRALSAKFLFRTTSVAENTDNLGYILRRIREINPRMRIVLTVSPVPLRVSFEHKSALMTDCISKSVLRVACNEIIRSMPDEAIYWPSFEYVRWLSGHTGAVFGVDDDNPLHVSGALIDAILRTFLATFSRPPSA